MNWKLEKFFRKYLSSKCSHGHVEYTIDNAIEKYWQKAKIFSLSVRKRKKKLKTFFRKTNLSNCSCKHVESSSGSPASIFFDKRAKMLCSMSGNYQHLDRFSDILNGKSSTECPKTFAQCARIIKIIWFFLQKIFSIWSHGHVESSFCNPAGGVCQFSPEGWKSFAHLWKR